MEKPTSRFVEIERKYLVGDSSWRKLATKGVEYCQGYLTPAGISGLTVRARVAGDRGFLTIKGRREGISRLEFEYRIPSEEAIEMITRMCAGRVVVKTRYRIPMGGVVWEVDEFQGANAGLILAEVELKSESQKYDLPSWIGDEVTEDRRFSSSSLSRFPYSRWRKRDRPM